jgi:hypothetical protein
MGLISKVPEFSQPTVEQAQAYIDAAVEPEGLQFRADYLKRFGRPPTPEQVDLAERQRKPRPFRPSEIGERGSGLKPLTPLRTL